MADYRIPKMITVADIDELAGRRVPFVGFAGASGTGKDTVARYLVGLGYRKESFANPIKDFFASTLPSTREQWEGITDESRKFREETYQSKDYSAGGLSPRELMVDLGNHARSNFGEDFWVNALDYRLGGYSEDSRLVISDVRFPNEVRYIKEVQKGKMYLCVDEYFEHALAMGGLLHAIGNISANEVRHCTPKTERPSQLAGLVDGFIVPEVVSIIKERLDGADLPDSFASPTPHTV